ncbi:MAG: DUF3842 family protein [Oscillospiraceae bacterium]|nr:DUF3842 family protein [Oscillospiraceae bacterium]
MKVLVIDGQGGRIGKQLVSAIRKELPESEIIAVGTNSEATRVMSSAGAESCATGENAVIVNCRRADFILGAIGIVIADAMLGEITPAMAAAVGQSPARRILIPFDHCDTYVVGSDEAGVSKRIHKAVEKLAEFVNQTPPDATRGFQSNN